MTGRAPTHGLAEWCMQRCAQEATSAIRAEGISVKHAYLDEAQRFLDLARAALRGGSEPEPASPPETSG